MGGGPATGMHLLAERHGRNREFTGIYLFCLRCEGFDINVRRPILPVLVESAQPHF